VYGTKQWSPRSKNTGKKENILTKTWLLKGTVSQDCNDPNMVLMDRP
jgi:hypothetical protein